MSKNKRLIPGTTRNPQDMTVYEFHTMARSRVFGRSIKQHVPIEPNPKYVTESAKLGNNATVRTGTDDAGNINCRRVTDIGKYYGPHTLEREPDKLKAISAEDEKRLQFLRKSRSEQRLQSTKTRQRAADHGQKLPPDIIKTTKRFLDEFRARSGEIAASDANFLSAIAYS